MLGRKKWESGRHDISRITKEPVFSGIFGGQPEYSVGFKKISSQIKAHEVSKNVVGNLSISDTRRRKTARIVNQKGFHEAADGF